MEVCCEPDRILRNPEYRAVYEAFAPSEELVGALRQVDRPVTVLIVFGYWCADATAVVPPLLKALAAADNPNLQVLLLHVAYLETEPSPFRAGPVEVTRYPTVCFLEGWFRQTEEITAGAELVCFVEKLPDPAGLTEALARPAS